VLERLNWRKTESKTKEVSLRLKKVFQGIYPALCTVCNDNGEIDEESQRRLIKFCIEKGVDGLAVSIFGGEFYKFSDKDRKRLIKIAVDETNGEVPVLFGASHFSTSPAIELGKYAEDIGADGLIVTPPLFDTVRASLTLEKHYEALANAVEIPIIIQDAEESTHVHMCSTFIAKLFKDKRIRYVKIEGRHSLTKIQEILELTERKMIIFGGMAGKQLLEEFSLGAKGNIPGCAIPELTVKPYEEYKKGNVEKAKEVFAKYRPYLEFRSLYPMSGNKLEKETLRLRGVISSSYERLPTVNLGEEAVEKLRKNLEEIGVQS